MEILPTIPRQSKPVANVKGQAILGFPLIRLASVGTPEGTRTPDLQVRNPTGVPFPHLSQCRSAPDFGGITPFLRRLALPTPLESCPILRSFAHDLPTPRFPLRGVRAGGVADSPLLSVVSCFRQRCSRSERPCSTPATTLTVGAVKSATGCARTLACAAHPSEFNKPPRRGHLRDR